MKKFPTIVVGAVLFAPGLCFSATVFSDDFNRASLGPDYAVTVTAGDGDARVNGSSFLELTNDTSAAVNANGRVSAAVAFSAFAAPFSGVLSGNSSSVTWEVNLRYNRIGDPSGFAGGGYAAAFVLGASHADFMSGTGYAVVYGSSATPEPFRLVRYTGGLGANANLTDIINPGVSGLSAVNNFASLRVVYDPVGGEWSLFARDDGASSWGTASTLGESNRVGTETMDTTYTGSALTHAGFFWNHSTAANQTVQFDNLRVQAVPEVSMMMIPGGAALLVFFTRRRRR